MNDDNIASQAVALFFDGQHAPQVIAKGHGEDAQRIIDVAKENHIPLLDNPELVKLLAKLELEDEIPTSLYSTIAHIIAFAYELLLNGEKEP